MEERNRMFRDYYRSLISISPSPPLPESPEPAPETAQSPLPLAEEGEESFDLRAEYVLLSGRLQTTERNLEMMGLEYDELLESVMQRTTEVVEKDEVIATLSAKMREAEKKAKEDVARERKINIGLAQGITNLGADLGALRRVLPIAYGHIQTVQCREHELLQEELIIAYLLRNEVDRLAKDVEPWPVPGVERRGRSVLERGPNARLLLLRQPDCHQLRGEAATSR
ncbi:hypothetical protein ANCCAN_18098 [Ancylostoma caninum]|uniref:Uncharacterized protein n=1 Tax=Ancylostoma caninum TaxID=29170 RepID=A0A368FZ44_ANCCA|nr:hypothetical protein ANCCAN_18098 [Ancylostoma caninum]